MSEDWSYMKEHMFFHCSQCNLISKEIGGGGHHKETIITPLKPLILSSHITSNQIRFFEDFQSLELSVLSYEQEILPNLVLAIVVYVFPSLSMRFIFF